MLWKDAIKSAHGEKLMDNPKVCMASDVDAELM